MKLINNEDLKSKINDYSNLNNSIFIEPMLNEGQISSVNVDLRLDVNFYVPLKTSNAKLSGREPKAGIQSFFSPTYRGIGENFIIFPMQYVIANSLEYIRLPQNIHAEVTIRSSFDRLGLSLYSIVQPGYAGVLSINLRSHAETPIELTVGSRIAQIKFFEIGEERPYTSYSQGGKYNCAIEPELPKLISDEENTRLQNIRNSFNT